MAINETNIVGDLFWTNMAAEQVYNSFEKRKTSVENLQKLIEWAFGLFGTGGMIGTFFTAGTQYTPLTLIMIGVGFAILVIAYYIATRAAFPVAMEMRPNQPEVISAAFTEALLISTRRFEGASTLTFVGFFIITCGILTHFIDPHQKEVPPRKEVSLSVEADTVQRGNTTFIPVTVTYQPQTKIDVKVFRKWKSDAKKDTVALAYHEVFKSDSTGRVYASTKHKTTPGDTYSIYVTAYEKLADKNHRETRITKDLP
jgi:hypothetical protein